MATTEEIQSRENINEMRRELQRRSLDQIKVFNPRSEPFFTIYDGYTHICEPNKEAIFPRYVAEKWMREFCDFTITEEGERLANEEDEQRKSRGQPVMDAQERDAFDIRNDLRTDNQEKRLEIMRDIYRGVSKEHGLDVPVAVPKAKDLRPLDQRLLEQLDKEAGTTFEEPVIDTEIQKDKLREELTDEESS